MFTKSTLKEVFQFYLGFAQNLKDERVDMHVQYIWNSYSPGY
jgi:hypothetical protein